MNIVFRSSEGDLELDVQLRNPDATLGDLLRAVLGDRAPDSAAIGDRVLPGSCALMDSGLHQGAIVTAPPPRPARGVAAGGAESRLELVSVAGRDSGRTFALATGRSSIGRTPENAVTLDSATLSREHFVIDVGAGGSVTVTDAGSANGTYVDGVRLEAREATAVSPECVIEAGAYALTIRSVTSADRPAGLDLRRQVTAAGTVPFNRPPRHALPVAPGTVKVPRAPSDPPKAHFSAASIFGPLGMAAVMITTTGDPRFAMFALLTPVIGLGTYYESRRRSSQSGLQSRGAYEREIEAFKRNVAEAGDTEWVRLRDRSPDPAEALRRAALPSVRLWERRPAARGLPAAVRGAGRCAVEAAGEGGRRQAATRGGGDRGVEHVVVAPVVRRPVRRRRPSASSAIAGRACHGTQPALPSRRSPRAGGSDDRRLRRPGREPDWEWCKWLPHTRDVEGRGERWLAGRREHSDRCCAGSPAGPGRARCSS